MVIRRWWGAVLVFTDYSGDNLHPAIDRHATVTLPVPNEGPGQALVDVEIEDHINEVASRLFGSVVATGKRVAVSEPPIVMG